MKKTCPKKTRFSMLTFSRLGVHFGSFWEALGPILGRFGRQNGVQERCHHWRKAICFFASVSLRSKIGIFTDLGCFGERFAMVWGVFGEDFWRIWLKFLGSLGKRITCVWEWLIACVWKQSRCENDYNNYKLQRTLPLEALVVSLKAVLSWFYEHFDRFETPCFSYSIFATIEAFGFPEISDATKTSTVSLVWATAGKTIWSNHFLEQETWTT